MKRTVPLWTTVTTGVVALIIGIAGGSGSKNKTTASSAAPAAATVTVTATATEAAAAPTSAAAPAGITDGTYLVGTDIKPGLYKTTGAADTSDSLPSCYWERDRDLSGGVDSIIANDNITGQTTVQIASTDKAFKTSGCAPWVKIG